MEAYLRALFTLDIPNNVLMIVGLLLTVYGGYKVLSKGLAIAFWMVLSLVGMAITSYSFKGSDFDFVTYFNESGVIAPEHTIGALRDDIQRLICEKIEAEGN